MSQLLFFAILSYFLTGHCPIHSSRGCQWSCAQPSSALWTSTELKKIGNAYLGFIRDALRVSCFDLFLPYSCWLGSIQCSQSFSSEHTPTIWRIIPSFDFLMACWETMAIQSAYCDLKDTLEEGTKSLCKWHYQLYWPTQFTALQDLISWMTVFLQCILFPQSWPFLLWQKHLWHYTQPYVCMRFLGLVLISWLDIWVFVIMVCTM